MRKNSTKSRDGLYAQDTTGPDSGSDIKSGDEGIDSIGTKFDSIGDGLFDNVYDEMNPRTGKADGEDSTKTPMAKMEDDLEKQWESMEQMGNELMYGASSTRKSVLAKEFLREQHVERLIPKRFLENLHRFETPKLEHESVFFEIFLMGIGQRNQGRLWKHEKGRFWRPEYVYFFWGLQGKNWEDDRGGEGWAGTGGSGEVEWYFVHGRKDRDVWDQGAEAAQANNRNELRGRPLGLPGVRGYC